MAATPLNPADKVPLHFPQMLKEAIAKSNKRDLSADITELLDTQEISTNFKAWANAHQSTTEKSPLLNKILSHINPHHLSPQETQKKSWKIARIVNWIYNKIKSFIRYLTPSIESFVEQTGESRMFKWWLKSGNKLPLIIDYLSTGLLSPPPHKLLELTDIICHTYKNSHPGIQEYWNALRNDLQGTIIDALIQQTLPDEQNDEILDTLIETLDAENVITILTRKNRPNEATIFGASPKTVFNKHCSVIEKFNSEQIFKLLQSDLCHYAMMHQFWNFSDVTLPLMKRLEEQHLVEAMMANDGFGNTLFAILLQKDFPDIIPLLNKLNPTQLGKVLTCHNQYNKCTVCYIYENIPDAIFPLLERLTGEYLAWALTAKNLQGEAIVHNKAYFDKIYPLLGKLEGNDLADVLTCRSRVEEGLIHQAYFDKGIPTRQREGHCKALAYEYGGIPKFLSRIEGGLIHQATHFDKIFPLIQKLSGDALVKTLFNKDSWGRCLINDKIPTHGEEIFRLIGTLNNEQLFNMLTSKERWEKASKEIWEKASRAIEKKVSLLEDFAIHFDFLLPLICRFRGKELVTILTHSNLYNQTPIGIILTNLERSSSITEILTDKELIGIFTSYPPPSNPNYPDSLSYPNQRFTGFLPLIEKLPPDQLSNFLTYKDNTGTPLMVYGGRAQFPKLISQLTEASLLKVLTCKDQDGSPLLLDAIARNNTSLIEIAEKNLSEKYFASLLCQQTTSKKPVVHHISPERSHALLSKFREDNLLQVLTCKDEHKATYFDICRVSPPSIKHFIELIQTRLTGKRLANFLTTISFGRHHFNLLPLPVFQDLIQTLEGDALVQVLTAHDLEGVPLWCRTVNPIDRRLVERLSGKNLAKLLVSKTPSGASILHASDTLRDLPSIRQALSWLQRLRGEDLAHVLMCQNREKTPLILAKQDKIVPILRALNKKELLDVAKTKFEMGRTLLHQSDMICGIFLSLWPDRASEVESKEIVDNMESLEDDFGLTPLGLFKIRTDYRVLPSWLTKPKTLKEAAVTFTEEEYQRRSRALADELNAIWRSIPFQEVSKLPYDHKQAWEHLQTILRRLLTKEPWLGTVPAADIEGLHRFYSEQLSILEKIAAHLKTKQEKLGKPNSPVKAEDLATIFYKIAFPEHKKRCATRYQEEFTQLLYMMENETARVESDPIALIINQTLIYLISELVNTKYAADVHFQSQFKFLTGLSKNHDNIFFSHLGAFNRGDPLSEPNQRLLKELLDLCTVERLFDTCGPQIQALGTDLLNMYLSGEIPREFKPLGALYEATKKKEEETLAVLKKELSSLGLTEDQVSLMVSYFQSKEGAALKYKAIDPAILERINKAWNAGGKRPSLDDDNTLITAYFSENGFGDRDRRSLFQQSLFQWISNQRLEKTLKEQFSISDDSLRSALLSCKQRFDKDLSDWALEKNISFSPGTDKTLSQALKRERIDEYLQSFFHPITEPIQPTSGKIKATGILRIFETLGVIERV